MEILLSEAQLYLTNYLYFLTLKIKKQQRLKNSDLGMSSVLGSYYRADLKTKTVAPDLTLQTLEANSLYQQKKAGQHKGNKQLRCCTVDSGAQPEV